MSIPAGTRLGPYEILSLLGAGGMGEVYRARDTRLERTVAIKVLPPHLSGSPESRQRFEREAKTISQLSHPHICALYDVGNQDGLEFLVMEYLEGETLAERLARGPMPLDQMLHFGMEISDALEKAHRQGIVHRDFKPANVMITKSGVKLLDFGLAKMLASEAPVESRTSAPTVAEAITREGMILGTLPYMAPEQLEGKKPDLRTDIFALGATLYEMAAGKKPFSGESQSSLISSIMTSEPMPISTVSPLAPPALDRLVKTCLAKDPEDRWQSAGDVGKQLRWIAEGSASGIAWPAISRHRRGARFSWLLTGMLAIAVLALSALLLSRRAPAGTVLRAAILPPEGAEFGPQIAISPDGSRLAFSARKGDGPEQLWVRALNESVARPLAGTEGAFEPFWSPDGRNIGFFADRALKKIDAGGGPTFTLAPAGNPRGATWSRNGVILFAPDGEGPVYRVSASGGKPAPATVYGPKDSTHRWPRFLPDGTHFLYLVRHSRAGAGEEPAIMIGLLDSKESKLAVNAASNALYASGYLLYLREGALVAHPFDPDALAAQGEPVTVAADVRFDERYSLGAFSASSNGVLAYHTGSLSRLSSFRWLDRDGKVLGTVGDPVQLYADGNPEISPDGGRATAAVVDSRTGLSDIWIIDLASGSRARFTTGGGDKFRAAWSPDGHAIAYNATDTSNNAAIFIKATSGSTTEKVLSEPVYFEYPCGFSPDGRFLLYSSHSAGRDGVWAVSLRGERIPRPVAVSAAFEAEGQFSPDGRYIAYVSDETGRVEIYVTAFPGPEGRWQVSQNGGTEPRWSKDGKELFFFAPDNRLMAAQIKSGPESFEVASIVPLFQARSLGRGENFRYDVAEDGRRFLISRELPQNFPPISLVTNWTQELRRK